MIIYWLSFKETKSKIKLISITNLAEFVLLIFHYLDNGAMKTTKRWL